MDLNASAPRLRREQVAGMNIHYIMWSLDYFLDVQQRLGFKTIELWAAEPHVTLDHTGYFEADKLRRKIESRGLSGSSLCPENVVYPWQYAARKSLHAQRSLAYFKHGIELAEVLGAPYMSINSGWGDWDEDREEAWKRSAEHLAILADYAGEHGVTLCMESLRPEESNLVVTLADARRMLDQVANPHLTPMVDTTAMGVAGESLEEWFAEFGDGAIRNMHFIDGDPYGHLVWGDGKHSMDDFVRVLNAHGFEGYLGQEITDGRYFDDPAAADRRNMDAFERYFVDWRVAPIRVGQSTRLTRRLAVNVGGFVRRIERKNNNERT